METEVPSNVRGVTKCAGSLKYTVFIDLPTAMWQRESILRLLAPSVSLSTLFDAHCACKLTG